MGPAGGGLLAQKFTAAHPEAPDPVDDEIATAELRLEAEDVNRGLTLRDSLTQIVVSGDVRDNVELTREEFEQATRELLDQTRVHGRNRREKAKGLGVDQIDRVLLVGGSSFMPAVGKQLAARFEGWVPELEDANQAVAKGRPCWASRSSCGPRSTRRRRPAAAVPLWKRCAGVPPRFTPIRRRSPGDCVSCDRRSADPSPPGRTNWSDLLHSGPIAPDSGSPSRTRAAGGERGRPLSRRGRAGDRVPARKLSGGQRWPQELGGALARVLERRSVRNCTSPVSTSAGTASAPRERRCWRSPSLRRRATPRRGSWNR